MQPRSDDHEVRTFLQMLRRRWLIVLATAVFVSALAFLGASMRSETFQSNAQVLIERGRADGINQLPIIDARLIANELATLNGQSLRQAVLAENPGVERVTARGTEGQDLITLTAEDSTANGAQQSITTTIGYYTTLRAGEFQEALELADQRIGEINTELSSPTLDDGYAQLLRTERLEIDHLQRELRDGAETGGVAIVTPAVLPRQSQNLSAGAIAIAAFIVGLVLGAALAGLVEHLDTRVRRTADVRRAAGTDLVVSLPDTKGRDPIVLRGSAGSESADIYRSLISSLVVAGVGESISTLHVGAVESPDASSVVAANIAIGLHNSGYDTVLASLDPWDSRLHRRLALEPQPGTTDIALGAGFVDQVKQYIDDDRTLPVITSGQPVQAPGDIVSRPAWAKTIDTIIGHADMVVFDGGIVAGRPAVSAIHADATVLVISSSTTEEQLGRATTALEAVGTSVVACVDVGSMSDGQRPSPHADTDPPKRESADLDNPDPKRAEEPNATSSKTAKSPTPKNPRQVKSPTANRDVVNGPKATGARAPRKIASKAPKTSASKGPRGAT